MYHLQFDLGKNIIGQKKRENIIEGTQSEVAIESQIEFYGIVSYMQ